MPVKVYKTDTSPPCRAVMLACEIFNVPVEYINVDLGKGEARTPEFLKLNPCHTVPVLVDGDLILHDSHAMLCYLADVYAKDSSWYPKDVKQRALVNQKLFFDGSVLFMRMIEVALPAHNDNKKGISEKQLQATEEAYESLEKFLSRTKYLAGDNITIADIAAYVEVGCLVYILKLDAKKYPKVNAWLNEFDSKPYSKKINAAGAKALGEFLQKAIAGESSH